MEQKQLSAEEQVFGVGFQRDANGNPIEVGIGSAHQRRVFPTEKPPTAPTKDQLTLLHRMVAATGNASLAKDFQEFLAWRNAREEIS